MRVIFLRLNVTKGTAETISWKAERGYKWWRWLKSRQFFSGKNRATPSVTAPGDTNPSDATVSWYYGKLDEEVVAGGPCTDTVQWCGRRRTTWRRCCCNRTADIRRWWAVDSRRRSDHIAYLSHRDDTGTHLLSRCTAASRSPPRHNHTATATHSKQIFISAGEGVFVPFLSFIFPLFPPPRNGPSYNSGIWESAVSSPAGKMTFAASPW